MLSVHDNTASLETVLPSSLGDLVNNASLFEAFETMPLHPKLLDAILTKGYKAPTEIQKRAIPAVLSRRDLLASAETGGGKTDAFVIPVLQRLIDSPPLSTSRGPRVVILTPTRELACQVTASIASLTQFTRLKFGTITGGVGYPAQEQLLRRPLDLLVATPGRLMDHMQNNRVDFSRIEIFILDEADRMLDMGFVDDMETIAEQLPLEHQTLLFSATLEGNVQKISRKFLKDPIRISLATATKKHTLISQRIHFVDNFNHKRALLHHVLETAGMWQAIVFTATKRGADDLVDDLSQKGIICAALHGDMKQSKRTRTLERMHRGQLKVLVATDVAARGLDVKKLSHVINFDLPRSVEDYIHRIGRTGRCGEQGIAISLVGPQDGAILAAIERFTGQKLERQVIPGFESRMPFEPKNGRDITRNARHNKRRFSSERPNSPNSRNTRTQRNYNNTKTRIYETQETHLPLSLNQPTGQFKKRFETRDLSKSHKRQNESQARTEVRYATSSTYSKKSTFPRKKLSLKSK